MNAFRSLATLLAWGLGVVAASGRGGAEPALAQPELTRDANPWTVGLSAALQGYYGTRTDWLDEHAWVKRQWPGASVAVGYAHLSRYGVWDDGVWADAYFSLWPQAYGNALVQVTPDSRISSRWDAAAEVFQSMGDGWEAAVRVRRMTFPLNAVWLVTPAAACYLGEWFVRARMTLVSPGAMDLSWSFQARRYLGRDDAFLEATAGLGVGELTTVTAAGSTVLAWSKSFLVKLQAPMASSYDIGVWAGVQDESSLGFSTTVGLELRWRP